MTLNVKVGEAKTRLSELLARVEQGEEVVISRGERQVARLTKIAGQADPRSVLDEIRRARATYKPVTQDEIQAWIREGRT